jgi:secreted PhoX family phosphatase
MSQDLNLIKRREFLQFFGKTAALVGLASCAPMLTNQSQKNFTEIGPFKGLKPMRTDTLRMAPGFNYDVLIKYNDVINLNGDQFGYDNDYLAIFEMPNTQDEFILWTNHENVNALFVSGFDKNQVKVTKSKDQVETEMKAVGGSLIHLKKTNGKYQHVLNSEFNRRLDANSKIPFSNGEIIKGQNFAIGTFANCAGGVTPWKTVLTAEENYQNFYGDVKHISSGVVKDEIQQWTHDWTLFYQRPPEHYGWIVEVNPLTGVAKKHTGLGRFAHEGATCVISKDKKVCVYLGDDSNDKCFYKFVSKDDKSLNSGTLYVANLEKGEWIALTMDHPVLKKNFKDQLEILTFARKAAKLVGGTPLDRPEDCEIDPKTGAVYLTCTNNFGKGRPFGSILKFDELDDYSGVKFKSQVFIAGGYESGIASPDNLAFDKKGNLWITTDMSDEKMGDDKHAPFGNNALFYVPMSGEHAGTAIRIAEAPMDAELTGPCFSPDGKTLFLSIQHPGANSKSLDKLTSHWPEGGSALPKPSVVQIHLPDYVR